MTKIFIKYLIYSCLITFNCNTLKNNREDCFKYTEFKIDIASEKLNYIYVVSEKLKKSSLSNSPIFIKNRSEFKDSLQSFNSCGFFIFNDTITINSFPIRYKLYKVLDFNIAFIVDPKYDNKDVYAENGPQGFFFTHKNVNSVYFLNFDVGYSHVQGNIKTIMKFDENLKPISQMRTMFNSEDSDIYITKFLYDDSSKYEGEVLLKSFKYLEINNMTKFTSVTNILGITEPEIIKDTMNVNNSRTENYFRADYHQIYLQVDYYYNSDLSTIRRPYYKIPETWVR